MSFNIAGLPQIDRIGEFPLLNPVFEFTYRNPTNVLHLYDYSGRVRINSREFPFRPGDLTCIESGSVYGYSSEAPGRHWCVHFHEPAGSEETRLELPEHLPLRVNSLFIGEQLKHISALFNTYGADENAELMRLEARHRLKALLLSIHTVVSSRTNHSRDTGQLAWSRMTTWIDANLNRPVSTSALADLVRVSPGTLARKFRQHYRVTISHYVLHKRIDKAKSLLATTTLPVHEVGSQVGIVDPQYFNKQFRKVAGTSPSRYREENREYLRAVPEDLATREGRWEG